MTEKYMCDMCKKETDLSKDGNGGSYCPCFCRECSAEAKQLRIIVPKEFEINGDKISGVYHLAKICEHYEEKND